MTRRRKALWIGVGVAAGLVFIVLDATMVCRDWGFICENTGSRKGHREWCTGWVTGEWQQMSELEAFMAKHHPGELTHRWTSYMGTGKNIFGGALLRGHGRPGPIVILRPAWLDAWVLRHPAGDVRELYDVFASDDEEAIQAKVDAIVMETVEYDE